MSLQLPLRLLLLIATIADAAVLTSSTSQAAGQAPWPGLPFLTFDPDRLVSGGTGGATPEAGWLGGGQVGLAGSRTGKQWAATPLTMVATNTVLSDVKTPTPVPPGMHRQAYLTNTWAYFVSPEGSVGGHNYGDSALIPVRTVAFGSIPVEATLQISQLRDDQGVPEEFELAITQKAWGSGSSGYTSVDPVHLQAEVIVRLRKLVIDGVDVRLTESCRTAGPAELNVSSQPWQTVPRQGTLNDQFDPAVGMLGQSGGRLEGTIDIPSLAGCTTDRGDNLSGMVSSVLSGDDNPVTIQVGAQGCFQESQSGSLISPPGPGQTTPEAAGCVPDPLLPSNPRIRVIPYPLPFPDQAPGDQP